jgi:hypothetical protein
MTMEASSDDVVREPGDGGETYASLLRILEIMTQLELVIEVHQHDRRALELWAAREREAIERERRLVRREARASWIARVRRYTRRRRQIIEIDEGLSSQRADAMGVAPRDFDTRRTVR